MSLVDQANFLLEKYNGSFTARQALEEGIASSILSRMVLLSQYLVHFLLDSCSNSFRIEPINII